MEKVTPTSVRAEAKNGRAAFWLETFSSLQHRNYRYLWLGTLLMGGGQWVQHVTLGWLLYDLTGSSILLGLLNGLRTIPFLVAGPIAGVVADRMDRRKLLLRAEYFLTATALCMGFLVASGLLLPWHLFLFTLLTGSAWSFTDPVRQSMVPNVVPKEDLMNAIALSSAGFNLMKVLGPAVGGLLIALFGAGGNFFVQSAAYAGVLVMVYRMRVPPTPEQARQSSMMANLKEGLSYVWTNTTVLALMIAALVPRVFAVPYQALMPIFQKDVLRVGPGGLGMLMAAPGVGAVLAVLMLASITKRFRSRGTMLLVSLVLLGVFLILFSQTSSFPLALLALLGVGSFQVLFMATTNTLLQLNVPDELRGRVMSIYMLDRGLIPAGSLMAGMIAHLAGAPATTAMMGGLVILLAMLLVWLMPGLFKIKT
ncbi:MAG: MFS transporter [Deltaproteobacteria bacterium]|nr:MFS transporter [Deltaproteobacteria bacterium]